MVGLFARSELAKAECKSGVAVLSPHSHAVKLRRMKTRKLVQVQDENEDEDKDEGEE